jgi:hypothetical protein
MLWDLYGWNSMSVLNPANVAPQQSSPLLNNLSRVRSFAAGPRRSALDLTATSQARIDSESSHIAHTPFPLWAA